MRLLQALGWTLVHFVWQGFAIAAVLALALAVTRRASAGFRYGLCAAALVLMVAVPAATLVRLSGTTHDDVKRPASSNVVQAAASSAGVREQASDVTASDQPLSGAQRSAGAPATRLATVRAWLELRMTWLVALWGLGVFLLSVRLLGGYLRARALTTQGTRPVDERWRTAVQRLAARLAISRPVRVLESALVAVPVVIGWLKPVLLLPASVFTGLTAQQLEAILAHELAHVRRHDYLVNLAQSAIEIVLFYHPAVWWVSGRVRQEREHCCDDLAVAISGNAHSYAVALVDLEQLRVGPAFPYAMAADGGSLVTRVRRLVAPGTGADTAPRWAAGAIAMLAGLAIGGALVPVAARAERAESQQATRDTVIRHPDPSAALADRWTWAARQGAALHAAGYWIGYTVRPPAGLDKLVYIDRQAVVVGHGVTLSGRMFGDFNGMRFPGAPIGPRVGGGDPGSIKLLLEFRGGSLARVHASSFDLPVDLGGRPMMWLGSAEDAPSLAQIEPLYGAARSVALKEQVIDAIGIHGSSALVVPSLERRLATGEPSRVREQAAEWLGVHPVPRALALLARLARTDQSPAVRREAAETVGEIELPAATDTLIALARTLDDADARREAVESLGQRDDDRARDALQAIAREDRRADVQREAIETLGHALPPADAVTLLAEMARSHRHTDVQREAVETLGEVGTQAAHAAVLAIARTHPHTDVRREAIETLGHAWATDETVEALSRLARSEADTDVQREAVETLGEIGGGIGLGAVAELATTHPHPDVRREAVETMGEHAPAAEALKVLNDALRNDGHVDVQREAIETLMELPDGAGVQSVIAAAREHRNPDIRRVALKTLAESEDPRVRALFDRVLGNP